MEFAKGKAKTKLQKLKGNVRGSGTSITFTPDPTIFPKTDFDPQTIADRLEITSFLHRGVKVNFVDEVNKTEVDSFFTNMASLTTWQKSLKERKASPIHETALHVQHRQAKRELNWRMQWTDSTDEHVRSYVNGIPTLSGGSHENGFRGGLTKAVRNYFDTHNLTPRESKSRMKISAKG